VTPVAKAKFSKQKARKIQTLVLIVTDIDLVQNDGQQTPPIFSIAHLLASTSIAGNADVERTQRLNVPKLLFHAILGSVLTG
jgi:hypothetical protein